MKKALIFENRIHEIVEVGSDFPVSPEMVWVDVADDVNAQTHIFSGGLVVLKPAKTPAEISVEVKAGARRDLDSIDRASLRALREWVVTQPGAPAFLVAREAAAVAARAKL